MTYFSAFARALAAALLALLVAEERLFSWSTALTFDVTVDVVDDESVFFRPAFGATASSSFTVFAFAAKEIDKFLFKFVRQVPRSF